MGDLLSQAEIDALLNGSGGSDDGELTDVEVDALGEIGNISMGTSATTLFQLLGQPVNITTPTVKSSSWEELGGEFPEQYVCIKVEYTTGIIGTNLLILREQDAKIITDLMMGGDGVNANGDLTDLHLSAISEAMNQMIGSAATSLSTFFDNRIEVSPPKAMEFVFDSAGAIVAGVDENEKIVKISFKMIIGDLIDSEIIQIIPYDFAKSLVKKLMDTTSSEPESPPLEPQAQQPDMGIPPAMPQQGMPQQGMPQQGMPQQGMPQQGMPQQGIPQQGMPQQGMPQQGIPQQGIPQQGMPQYGIPQQGMPQQGYGGQYVPPDVNVQQASFQNFEDQRVVFDKKNIGLIMDVALSVTVELGRTSRLIRDILEFGTGTIIELDKLAGEPVDILVNSKIIAKGEVVVIDESFGVRLTEILEPAQRI